MMGEYRPVTTNSVEVINEEPRQARPSSETVHPDEQKPTVWGRRDFFTLAGWGAFLTASFAFLVGSVRFFFPRVVYQPPVAFKAGFPDEYPPGTVSTKWQEEYRTVIVRNDHGEFYALKMGCTHLGCAPIWNAAENKFKCPCHGSGFDRRGVNFEGPAPRPLERFEITLAEDGQLLVNRGKVYRKELGEWKQSLLSLT